MAGVGWPEPVEGESGLQGAGSRHGNQVSPPSSKALSAQAATTLGLIEACEKWPCEALLRQPVPKRLRNRGIVSF